MRFGMRFWQLIFSWNRCIRCATSSFTSLHSSSYQVLFISFISVNDCHLYFNCMEKYYNFRVFNLKYQDMRNVLHFISRPTFTVIPYKSTTPHIWEGTRVAATPWSRPLIKKWRLPVSPFLTIPIRSPSHNSSKLKSPYSLKQKMSFMNIQDYNDDANIKRPLYGIHIFIFTSVFPFHW